MVSVVEHHVLTVGVARVVQHVPMEHGQVLLITVPHHLQQTALLDLSHGELGVLVPPPQHQMADILLLMLQTQTLHTTDQQPLAVAVDPSATIWEHVLQPGYL